jgi:hypothetical protein
LKRLKPLPLLEPLQQEQIEEMVQHLRRKASATVASAQLAESTRARSKQTRRTPEAARDDIALAKALYESGRFTESEYLFFSIFPIEDIHQSRWLEGAYESELGPIGSKMDSIARKYGLADDEYWTKQEAPQEYLTLSDEYEANSVSEIRGNSAGIRP